MSAAHETRAVDQAAEPEQQGSASHAGDSRSAAVRLMQGRGGNRAASRMVRVQTKLAVGAADDHYEHEADDVARRVVQALSGIERAETTAGVAPVAQRVTRLQRRAQVGAEGGEVDGETATQIDRARGRGAPLDAGVRDNMESAFGSDFSSVRVHTGTQSADLNNRLQAKAFTVGSDIFFNGSMPDPSASSGQELLAHELTHVVQQGGAPAGAQRVQRLFNPLTWLLGGDEEDEEAEPEIGAPTEVKTTTATDLVAMVKAADEATRAHMATNKTFLAQIDAVLDAAQKQEVLGLLEAAAKSTGGGDAGSSPDAGSGAAIADAKSKAEEEERVKQEQEAAAKQEADERAKAEEAERAKQEQQAKAKQEADAAAKAEQEAKDQAEAKAKQEAEAAALAESQAKAAAEQKAKEEAEAKAKADADAKALQEAEAKRIAEQDAKLKTTAEISALDLGAFLAYVEETPDWNKRSTMTPIELADLGQVLSFAAEKGVAAALDATTVSTILADTTSSLGGTLAEVLNDLRVFVTAVVGNEPIALSSDPDLSSARAKGYWLQKMIAEFGAWVLRAALDENAFDYLIRHSVVDDVIAYHKTSTPQPIFQADDGGDFLSYLRFRFDDGGDPGSYCSGPLAGYIRNFHRFERDALDKLAKNVANGNVKNRPLTLVLHTALDYNSAFHRDPYMTAVITNKNIFAVLVEGGESLGDYQAQIAPLAVQFGVNGKIDQVMFAGHGNSRFMEMAGTVAPDLNGQLKQKRADINLDDPTGAADALFDEVLANMDDANAAALRDPTAVSFRRILFNACLTNSSTVDMVLADDNAAAKVEIIDYLDKNASLASYLGKKAKAQGYDVSSLGANASINQVELIDASGGLDLVTSEDPYVTSSKLEYAEHGNEPAGVIRAALEAWATDTPAALAAMARRAAVGSQAWDDVIIEGIYSLFIAKPDELGRGTDLQIWSRLAASISEMKSDSHCNVQELRGALVDGGDIPYVDALLGKLQKSNEWTSTPTIQLVMLQAWLGLYPGDTKLRNRLLACLATFDAKTAMKSDDQYVDIGYLQAQGAFAKLLANLGPGQTVLALIAMLDGGAPPEAKAYLKKLVVPAAAEIPALPAVAEVPPVLAAPPPRAMVPAVPIEKGRPKVVGIKGKRPAAAAVPDLPALPELPEVLAPEPTKPKDTAAPVELGSDVTPPEQEAQDVPVVVPDAPGRPGRPARAEVPKVAAVKPHFVSNTPSMVTALAKRATEDDILALLK